jgi:hypothetical protein
MTIRMRPAAPANDGRAPGSADATKPGRIPLVTGTIRTRNDDLARTPGLVNTDPYGQGWIFEAEIDPSTGGPAARKPDACRRLPQVGRCLMDYKIEVVTVPVTDVDQALAFYTRQACFTLVVDYHPASGFRVVQLTSPGSACSVQIGVGLNDAPPGSARATYLAVTDIEAGRRELAGRGVKVGTIRHKSPIDDWKGGWRPGADPKRRDYANFAGPDGNTWVPQEIGCRPTDSAADGERPA